jgi:hypothetical protein
LPSLRGSILKSLVDILDTWVDTEVVNNTLSPLRNIFLGDEESQKEFCYKLNGVQKLLPLLQSKDDKLKEETLKTMVKKTRVFLFFKIFLFFFVFSVFCCVDCFGIIFRSNKKGNGFIWMFSSAVQIIGNFKKISNKG